jgi:hypothetical protein
MVQRQPDILEELVEKEATRLLLLVSCLPYSSTLKMRAYVSPKYTALQPTFDSF